MSQERLNSEALRNGDTVCAALFDMLTEAFAYCRLDYDAAGAAQGWAYVDVNEAFTKLVGEANVVGRTYEEMGSKWRESSPDLLSMCGRVAATGTAEQAESHFPVLGKWLAVRVASHAPGHVLMVLEDITARRQATETLRRLQISLDHASDYPLWVDSEARLTAVSESTSRCLGYSRDELLSMTVFDLDPTLSPSRWEAHWRTMATTGSRVIQTQHRTKSGQTIPVEIATNRVAIDGVEYDCDFCRDITDRVQSEEKLQRAQFSLDQATDYPVWLDAEGRIIEVSDSTCRHLGYTRDELLSLTVFDIDPLVSPKQWPAIWKRNSEAGSRIFETQHQTKAGRIYPVEIAATHVLFDGVEYGCDFCRDISERMQAEEQLKRAQFSLDHTSDYPVWVDEDGRICEVSESTCRQLEYTREELLAMSIMDIDPSMTKEVWPRYWPRGWELNTQSLETEHRTKSGRMFPVEISLSRVSFGGRAYDCAFCRDISKRRHSEERYRQLFELESDAILVTDDETGRILDANSAAVDLYGYRKEELLTLHSSDLTTEPEPERVPRESSISGADVRFNRRRDGTLFPAEVRHGYFTLDGRALRVAAVRDVTERLRAEEEIVASRRRLQTVLDTVPLYVVWKDRDLRFLGCNVATALAAHLPDAASIVGKMAEDLPHIPIPLAALEDELEVMRTGTPKLQYEEVLGRPDAPRMMRSSKVPLRNRVGEIVGVLCVHEDVTDRTMTRKALQEREEQLRQSQKMEAIGRLAGGIAHDFNNVLTTIIGYSDLLLASPAAKGDLALAEDIGEIRTAAERASSLTRGILAFSRRQTLRPRVLSLNSVISETQRLLDRTLGEDIKLQVHLQEDLGVVEVDEVQFVQVLLNLAVNARDAMPAGGTLLIATANVDLDEEFCRTHPDVNAGPYALVSVSDNGIGMDEETAAHVFEPFYTTKAPGEGTGLGLSTVYGIVAQSGGCVDLTTELGEGTRFDIYLPRFDQLVEPAGGRSLLGAGIRPTILLVDDDNDFRHLTERILEKNGFRVLPVADGDHAAALLDDPEIQFDLLVTDVVLRGSLQGIHVAQRAATLRPHVGVIYISAYPRDTLENTGRLEEGTDFLEKPFTPQQLVMKVRQMLESRR